MFFAGLHCHCRGILLRKKQSLTLFSLGVFCQMADDPVERRADTFHKLPLNGDAKSIDDTPMAKASAPPPASIATPPLVFLDPSAAEAVTRDLLPSKTKSVATATADNSVAPMILKTMLNNRITSLQAIHDFCAAHSVQLTHEHFVIRLDALAKWATNATTRDRYDTELLDLTVLCATSGNFWITLSMRTTARDAGFLKTAQLLDFLFQAQDRAIISAAHRASHEENSLSLDSVSAFAKTAVITAAEAAVATPAASEPVRAAATTTTTTTTLNVPIVTRKRRSNVDDNDKQTGCCVRARRAYYQQHGDAVGSACIIL
jgi:hypothetical protein